jgi:alpha,alpha-trehalase
VADSSSVEATGTTIDRTRFDAVVFTLDAVLVDSDRLLAAVWKQAFDGFLAVRHWQVGKQAFDTDLDYGEHVRGHPRDVAAARLLVSRGLTLPRGKPTDGPQAATAWGLAKTVEHVLQARLRTERPSVREPAARLARTLRGCGFQLGVVSPEPDAGLLLRSAGLGQLFHARVDGRDVMRFRLRPWPTAEFWSEVLRRSQVSHRRAAAFVNGPAEAAAATQAGIATVWNVDGMRTPEGQDVFELFSVVLPATAKGLPSALAHLETIAPTGTPMALFLDFDGTLTGITGTPREAVLADVVRETLATISARGVPVAIVSGRDLENLQARVNLPTLYYAGSHGFDLAGPDGLRYEHPEALAQLSALDTAEQFLHAQLDGLTGALVERKRFALAAHYRRVAPAEVHRVEKAVEQALAMHSGLRAARGKKVIELLPGVDWHKGRAMEWLRARMMPDAWTLYIGDDQTDEDALALLGEEGAGIAVQEEPTPTTARYALANPDEVLVFLKRFAERLTAAAAE